MAVSKFEYAMLSNAVYHDKNYINPANYGFEKVDGTAYDRNGFYCETYKRGNDVVIVFRGSDNALNFAHDYDWQRYNITPPEFGDAVDYANMIKDRFSGMSITMTGHSLGGGAVQYVNAMVVKNGGDQLDGVTFGAGGVGNLEECRNINPADIHVTNVAREGDPVPNRLLPKHLGTNEWMPAPCHAYNLNSNGELIESPLGVGGAHSVTGYMVDVGGLPSRPPSAAERTAEWRKENNLSMSGSGRSDQGYAAVMDNGGTNTHEQRGVLQQPFSEVFDFHKALAEHSKGNDEMYARLDALRGGQIVAQQLPQQDQGLARC